MQRRVVSHRALLGWTGILAAAACSVGGDGGDPRVTNFAFQAIVDGQDNLLQADVDAIVAATSQSVDHPNLAIAVVDRLGNILRVYNRQGLPAVHESNAFAVAIARASAYLSHSQAPLTSRTGQFLSTFHFPGVFDVTTFLTAPPNAFPGFTLPIQPTVGVVNTPQAPLWQIDASNRGGMDEIQAQYNLLATGETPPLLQNPDVSTPAPGLGPLPGGVPLYKTPLAFAPGGALVGKRLVGAVGVYAFDTDPALDPRPDVAEFAAFTGAAGAVAGTTGENFLFPVALPPEGGVYLVGILLPFIDPPVRPADQNPGPLHDATLEVCTGGGACADRFSGAVDGFSVFDPTNGNITDALVGPVASAVTPPGGTAADALTAGEVEALLRGCVRASRITHAAIRLPANAACQMIIAVCDTDGVLLGVFREEDATLFSLEISVSKARNAVFFSSPFSVNNDPDSPPTTDGQPTVGRHPLFVVFGDALFGDPAAVLRIDGNPATPDTGIAVTARSLGFLSQPFYPPTIEGTLTGPLFSLANENRDPQKFNGQGFAEASGVVIPGASGVIFFPGSAPLYKNGVLVGGIGVSGDGVEQDDFVTTVGIRFAETELGIELEPDPAIRVDNFGYAGTRIPYAKFPQNPGG